MILGAALSLVTIYGLTDTSLVQEVSPKNLDDYRRILAEHPNVKCECSASSIKYSDFGSMNVSLYAACGWIEQDLKKVPLGADQYGVKFSACAATGWKMLCEDLQKSCQRGEKVTRWMFKEFNNTPVASMELLSEEFLNQTLATKVDSLREMPELVTMTSIDISAANAAHNLPRIVDGIGDIAQRVQLLTLFDAKKWNTSHQQYGAWKEFEESCIASSTNKEITLWNGTTFTPSVPCDPANDLYTYFKAGTWKEQEMKLQCYTKECLFGGFRKVIRQEADLNVFDPASFLSVDTRLTFDLYGALIKDTIKFALPVTHVGTWLDVHTDGWFLDNTRQICSNPSTWHDTKLVSTMKFSTWLEWLFSTVGQSWPESARDTEWHAPNGCDVYTSSSKVSPFVEGKNDRKTYEQFRIHVDSKIQENVQKVIAGELTPLGPVKEWYIGFALNWLSTELKWDDMMYNLMFPMWGETSPQLARIGKENWTNANMIETVELSISYGTYFDACAPKTCSYVVSGRLPASTLASIILGVLGGFASVCAVLFHGIYSVIRFFALGPERSDEDEEEEEVMSGHPPRAAGLFTGAGPPRPSGYAA